MAITHPSLLALFRGHLRLSFIALSLWTCLTGYMLMQQFGVKDQILSSLTSSVSTQWWNAYTSAMGPDMCSSTDIEEGTWRQGNDTPSWDALMTRYHYYPNSDIDCKPVGQNERIMHPTIGDRAYNVAHVYLEPARPGCLMYPFEEEAYIIRLLRSPAGMFLVGDSITDHHMRVIINLLETPTKRVKRTYSGGVYDYLHLVRDHPDVPRLLQLAGVPESRLDFPLVSFWRDNHLLNEKEKAQVFQATIEKFDPEDNPRPDWYPIMTDLLERATARQSEFALLEPHVLILNVGAHWSDTELGKTMVEKELLAGFANMVNLVEKKVQETPYPISAYWRTMAPGQIHCQIIDDLDNNRADLFSPIDPKEQGYNYLQFTEMNSIMSANTTLHRERGVFDYLKSGKPTRSNPPFRLLNVWPMSVKRPEAHLGPPQDCLHWCRPGPQDYWQQLLWQMLIGESINDDYYVL